MNTEYRDLPFDGTGHGDMSYYASTSNTVEAPLWEPCKCGHSDWAHDGLGCIECGCLQ